MVEQIANGNGLPVSRKFRKKVSEVIVIMQLAIARQQHNARRRELLGKRRQPKIRSSIDGSKRPQISNPISPPKHGLAVVDDEHSSAGSTAGF